MKSHLFAKVTLHPPDHRRNTRLEDAPIATRSRGRAPQQALSLGHRHQLKTPIACSQWLEWLFGPASAIFEISSPSSLCRSLRMLD